MTDRVTVVGSINQDITIRVPRLPEPGETVLGGAVERHFGGKGANQAVAAARAGARVTLVGAVGDDAEGRAALENLRSEEVDVTHVAVVPDPTGQALIVVDRDGENQIVVSPGANATLRPDQAAALAAGCDVLLASLEVPMDAVVAAARSAMAAGATLVLDPAPATTLSDSLLRTGPILTPNAGELAAVSGEMDVPGGIDWLRRNGILRAAVTLGAGGVVLVDGDTEEHLPGLRVDAVDATGAGDAFAGILAAWLAGGASFRDAVLAANAGAALSVTGMGARSGMPERAAIQDRLRS